MYVTFGSLALLSCPWVQLIIFLDNLWWLPYHCRVGVANFITLLIERIGADIKPYANMLVRLLFPVVKDEKSAIAKRAFSSACAKVLNYVATSHAQKLIEDTVALHAGDRNSQIACAYLLKSYSSLASDVVSGYLAVIIPVVFLSRFELLIYLFLLTLLKWFKFWHCIQLQ